MLLMTPIDNAPAGPDVPGLVFRGFRGPEDFPLMAAVIAATDEVDGRERVETAEDLAASYAHLSHSDTARDMILAEVDGHLVAYGRAAWYEEADGPLLYTFALYVDPAWRGKGIGRAMQRWLEDRLARVAAEHDPARPKFFQNGAVETETYHIGLLEGSGYRPVRHFFDMVRPSLDDIPDFPLPEGLEVRPALPEQYRAIWEADVEAFRDHWGYSVPTEEDYLSWLNDPTVFQPELWQVAWDVATDEVAGQVRTFIDYKQNEKYGRRRGWTEFISVRRPWRRRGLARALIARSLRAQRDAGMAESALGVDSENTTGATRVYEDCGFRVVKRGTIYRKPLEPITD